MLVKAACDIDNCAGATVVFAKNGGIPNALTNPLGKQIQ
jgi:hypothetical protein